MTGRQKYFQIGFRKCGTTTLWDFFRRNGIPAVHWDGGDLARRMRDNLEAGRRILDGYDHRYDAFTDMEFNDPDDWFEGFRRFRELLRHYPDAKFILNTREREAWLLSMRRWARRTHRRRYLKHRYGTASLYAFSRKLAADRKAHHDAVVATIPPHQLLVFDIEADDPEKLCRFCGLPVAAGAHYAHRNRSRGDARYYGRRLLGRLPDSLKRTVRLALRVGRKGCRPSRPGRADPRGSAPATREAGGRSGTTKQPGSIRRPQ